MKPTTCYLTGSARAARTQAMMARMQAGEPMKALAADFGMCEQNASRVLREAGAQHLWLTAQEAALINAHRAQAHQRTAA